MLIVASCRVLAGCVDPATLAQSTVSIVRYFDDSEREGSTFGIAGTAWFLSPTLMGTIEHVSASMHLSSEGWKRVEIRTGETKQSVAARVRYVAGAHAERIAVLELQTPLSSAQALPLRMEPLAAEEPLISLAYPKERLRVANGRFVEYGSDKRLAGAALLEMYDGNDRLVLDHGASGAPVLDCTGHVVSVVSNLFTTTMHFMSREVRISTAWGAANVAAVPVQVLKDFVSSKDPAASDLIPASITP
jgi:hypothetical protein